MIHSISMNSIPWKLIAEMSCILACAVPFLTVCGIPFIALAGQLTARARQRSAYDKCARQLAFFGTILGSLLCIGGAYFLWIRIKAHIAVLSLHGQTAPVQLADWRTFIESSINVQADGLIWLTLMAATFLLSLYTVLWRTLRTSPLIHQCLALVAAFWYCLALYGFICIIYADANLAQGTPYPHNLKAIFLPAFFSPPWNCLPYMPALIFSMAGGFGTVWLILRRKYDDFGRDYYAQMLPWCAKWARNTWLLLWLMLIGVAALQWIQLIQQADVLITPEFIYSAVFLAMWIIPGLLWTLAIRSATPLRHKLTFILAFLLSTGIIIPLYTNLVHF